MDKILAFIIILFLSFTSADTWDTYTAPGYKTTQRWTFNGTDGIITGHQVIQQGYILSVQTKWYNANWGQQIAVIKNTDTMPKVFFKYDVESDEECRPIGITDVATLPNSNAVALVSTDCQDAPFARGKIWYFPDIVNNPDVVFTTRMNKGTGDLAAFQLSGDGTQVNALFSTSKGLTDNGYLSSWYYDEKSQQFVAAVEAVKAGYNCRNLWTHMNRYQVYCHHCSNPPNGLYSRPVCTTDWASGTLNPFSFFNTTAGLTGCVSEDLMNSVDLESNSRGKNIVFYSKPSPSLPVQQIATFKYDNGDDIVSDCSFSSKYVFVWLSSSKFGPNGRTNKIYAFDFSTGVPKLLWNQNSIPADGVMPVHSQILSEQYAGFGGTAYWNKSPAGIPQVYINELSSKKLIFTGSLQTKNIRSLTFEESNNAMTFTSVVDVLSSFKITKN